jgi:NADP-dependent 3-hydroxy acid dehydrogenase YdfG
MYINVKGIYQVSRFAVPELEKTKGNIVNIASTRGLTGYPKTFFYLSHSRWIALFLVVPA